MNKDIDILSTEYEVNCFNFRYQKKWKTPFQLCRQFIFILRHIISSKGIICQLSGYHSFLPVFLGRLLNIPTLIIAGGTDCHSFPSIGYGNFQKRILKIFTKWSFENCSHIAPKHESLILCDYSYDQHDFSKQGIRYFINDFNKEYTVIANGYNDQIFKKICSKKKNHFLTVSGNLNAEYQQELKGIDLILFVAKDFPDCTFTIIGVSDISKFHNISNNIKLVPPLKNDELVKYYSESEYYLQLSMAEGFPNSLCEAMLCECIPIGSNVFSIPEIISDTGYILMHRDLDELKNLIQLVIQSDNSDKGQKARARISKNYPVLKRRKLLLDLMNKITSILKA